ncbi:hypothetical protein L208DRAFT_1559270 [Tricholoma matsutake]|nr:hypothetical protein L208DRAFT_1559270 [Tricholoma matsutake 945]
MACGPTNSECYVLRSVSMMQPLVVQHLYLIYSLTSRNNAHWYKRSLHRLVIFASSFLNFIIVSLAPQTHDITTS